MKTVDSCRDRICTFLPHSTVLHISFCAFNIRKFRILAFELAGLIEKASN